MQVFNTVQFNGNITGEIEIFLLKIITLIFIEAVLLSDD